MRRESIHITIVGIVCGVVVSSIVSNDVSSTISNLCRLPSVRYVSTRVPIMYYSASGLVQTPRSNEYLIDETATVDPADIEDVCSSSTCPFSCCKASSSTCAGRVNTNGMLLQNGYNYLLVYGGLDTQNLTNSSVLDSYNIYDSSSGADYGGIAGRDAYMIDGEGRAWVLSIPDGAPRPPRLYDHCMLIVKQTGGLFAYVFGGRSPDVAGGVSNQLWRFTVPYGPEAMGEGGNVWAEVVLSGCTIPGLFGTSMIEEGGFFYVYGGMDKDYVMRTEVFKIDYSSGSCETLAYSVEKREVQVRLWDGSASTSVLRQEQFQGRIRPLTKFESQTFAVIDGFTLDSEKQVVALKRIHLLVKNSTGDTVARRVKFDDELFRQTTVPRPFCYVTYTSHTPQIHIVAFQQNGYLEVKQVRFDTTQSNTVNSYNEVLTFSDMPKRKSKFCSMSIGRSSLMIYSIDENDVPYIISTKVDVVNDTRVAETKFGLNLCREGFSGNGCEPNCPDSYSFNDLRLIERYDAICFNRGTCSSEVCGCDAGYLASDCSERDCPNNCSNDEISDESLKSECVKGYPESYCRCSVASKRGGDDCSKIFCLNECGSSGACVGGVCKCESKKYAPDCSVFEIELYRE